VYFLQTNDPTNPTAVGGRVNSVHLVGALPRRGAAGWQPPAWWAELVGSRPVVVVTQGALANRDLSQLVEPALAGLADLDVTVVSVLGREAGALPVPVPPNAHVAARVAYHELGINLHTATPAPEDVTAATETVLKDTWMHDSVRKLAQVYDALGEIERLTLG
jgi:UDP:flavonoid glycosyltransferase YjiC (YdhE family)